MKSPFPGMDPYIEHCRLWKDFHAHLIEKTYDVVSAALPRRYVARVGERSYISLVEEEEKKERAFKPGVRVTGPRERKRNRQSETQTATGSAAEQDSVAFRAFIEEDFEERFIDIYEREPERRLVTSIEVLSPSNKKPRSPGRKKYLRKRQALLLGRANLVEIDLLRGGARMPMLDPLPDSPHYLLVAREKTAPVCRVWRGFVDRPLPPISIPLCPPDHDIPLELQPIVEAIYERSRYGDDIDYAQPVVPPLTPEQAGWLQQQLQNTRTASTAPAKRRPRRSNR
jgi:hypothetical protein